MSCIEAAGMQNKKAVLFDPCCGGGYLLTVLGFLCGEHIASIYASDISPDAAALAGSNLGLLTVEGLRNRKTQLERIYGEYKKVSHFEAIGSAERMIGIIRESGDIASIVFTADIMDGHALAGQNFKADIVFTDVPYGNLTSWSQGGEFAAGRLLDALLPVLRGHSVIAISSDKKQRIANPNFKRIKKIQVGKRKIEFLQKAADCNDIQSGSRVGH